MDLPSIPVLEEVLLNASEPITKRMRALFYLRTIGNEEVIPIISKAFSDPSLLLQHEICYVLGQIKHIKSLEFLKQVLENEDNAVISRHEAAEAIAAIGEPSYYETLEKYANHQSQVLAETCQLAIDRLRWLEKGEK